jgi:hypothetical protein
LVKGEIFGVLVKGEIFGVLVKGEVFGVFFGLSLNPPGPL